MKNAVYLMNYKTIQISLMKMNWVFIRYITKINCVEVNGYHVQNECINTVYQDSNESVILEEGLFGKQKWRLLEHIS
jgi:hypothetical protein